MSHVFFRGDSKIHAKLFILIREIITLSLEKLVVRNAPVGGIVIILPFSAGTQRLTLENGGGGFLPQSPCCWLPYSLQCQSCCTNQLQLLRAAFIRSIYVNAMSCSQRTPGKAGVAFIRSIYLNAVSCSQWMPGKYLLNWLDVMMKLLEERTAADRGELITLPPSLFSVEPEAAL